MNKFAHLIHNLTYVKVDRAAARNDWWTLANACATHRGFWEVNRSVFVSQKAVAGILSHRQTRGFIKHRIKERMLRRRLAA